MENRVVGDLLKLAGAEKKVRVPGTARTAWRDIGYRQVPYQRCEGCSGSQKTLFLYFSRNRNRSVLVQSRQAPPSTFGC